MPTIKPPKPFPTFPLFAHDKGYWAKKIAGRQVTFGPWAWPDPVAYEETWKAALKAYNAHAEAEAMGSVARNKPEDLTLEYLIDAYLTWQHGRQASREITGRMFFDARRVLTEFRDYIGRDRTIGDLERRPALVHEWRASLEGRLGWHSFNRYQAIAAACFNWAADSNRGGVLGRATPIKGCFEKKAIIHLRRSKRKAAAEHGRRMWEPDELKALIDHSTGMTRVFVLLGYFAAYGNNDLAELPAAELNLKPDADLPPGWATIHFPRPKTEIDRATVLPPIVVEAITAATAVRRPAAEPRWKPLLFRTEKGYPYLRQRIHRHPETGQIQRVVTIDSVALLFVRLRDRLGKCPCHGWVRRRGENPQAAGWDLCPVVTGQREAVAKGQTPEGPKTIRCGRELVAMRKLGFRTFRRTAITLASGAADNDVLHRWRGHALAGMNDVYVETVEAHKLKLIADRLLERLAAAGVVAGVTQSASPGTSSASAVSSAGVVAPPLGC